MGVFHPKLFREKGDGVYGLTEVLLPYIKTREVSGEYFNGEWCNLNTPAELESLKKQYES
jgi:NDP-sugar pyrophosphorylase family protein